MEVEAGCDGGGGWVDEAEQRVTEGELLSSADGSASFFGVGGGGGGAPTSGESREASAETILRDMGAKSGNACMSGSCTTYDTLARSCVGSDLMK